MSDTPIQPRVPPGVQQALLERLLGTRSHDRAALEAGHRDLLAASPELARVLLRWLASHDPEAPMLSVGLAVLGVSGDPVNRRLVAELLDRVPLGTVADTVDYIHGWYVDRRHTRLSRKRFQDEMTQAYEATAGAVRESVAAESAQDASFQAGDILVTLGTYDKVQQVLDHLQLPYRTTPCNVVHELPLRADCVLIVNCPGQFTAEDLEAIRRFVLVGGTLITTDWALQTTVEPAFPGTIQYNQRPTSDDVVAVSWLHPDSPYTRGVEVPGQTISWWLEGQSYPIRVLDPRVTVLVRSEEMGRKYGEDPLVVTFAYGEGRVFHLTSHYYLQRSQGDKSVKDQKPTAAAGQPAVLAEALASGLQTHQLAAAYSSMRLLANILFHSRRQCGI
jgi:hypothetical protein